MSDRGTNGEVTVPKRKLTDAFVRSIDRAGKYGDEHGLILRVRSSGSKQWIWRGTVGGRRVDLGLGGYPYTSLAEARQTAFEHRKCSRAGGDPRARARSAPTFADAAEKVIAIHRTSWRPGSKSEGQWRSSLNDYAKPSLGGKRVDQISTADVMGVLLPIWSTKAETARRLRQRVSAIMKWAIAQGYRPDNPAGEALGAALPKNTGQRSHFRALPHTAVTAAVQKVRTSRAWAGTKQALEFLVLTAGRSGEVRLAQWDEIDFETATWTVPHNRMKAGRQHRVPLSDRALELLQEARQTADRSGLVFPSSWYGRALSQSTLSKLLRDLSIPCVPHGFRTSFRTWCGETGVAREVAEAALAHVVRNKVEAAYARGDLLEPRRAVMEAWSRYVEAPEGRNSRRTSKAEAPAAPTTL
ncbi:MAG: tyrosine-type recombinase/integrase [Acidobacteriota bacterium]|nr:tyrosine-type recombinase/integrase [Acidobacteriota bacterium]